MYPGRVATAAAEAAAGAGARAVASGMIIDFFEGKNKGLSAARSLMSKISDEAKALAATIKVDDTENFFVKLISC